MTHDVTKSSKVVSSRSGVCDTSYSQLVINFNSVKVKDFQYGLLSRETLLIIHR